jgi:hypothetical protein
MSQLSRIAQTRHFCEVRGQAQLTIVPQPWALNSRGQYSLHSTECTVTWPATRWRGPWPITLHPPQTSALSLHIPPQGPKQLSHNCCQPSSHLLLPYYQRREYPPSLHRLHFISPIPKTTRDCRQIPPYQTSRHRIPNPIPTAA